MKFLGLMGVAVSVLTMSNIFYMEAASAGNCNHPGRVNKRQVKQDARLDHGKANGELTRRENRRLQAQQMKLARKERRMRASGDGLTKQERKNLEKSQDRLSGNIYEQKHDAQDRN